MNSASDSLQQRISPKPNIIYILADDLGYGDIGAYNAGSKIPTPHIDAMAAQGIRFHDAHSCSALCTPSRYGILTGRYCWRSRLSWGVLGSYEPPLIEPERLTVAGLLKNAGYRTACVGKWHLGLGYAMKPGESFDFDAPDSPWEDLANTNPGAARAFEEKIDFHARLTGGPTERGFEEFFGTSGCCTAQPPYGFIENDRFVDPPSRYDDTDLGRFKTGRPGMMSPSWRHDRVDVIHAEKAVEFIEDQADGDEPFFLYLAANAPHEPCRENMLPDFARHKSAAGWRGDMVWLFDWMVGQVTDALERTGQADNTLIIVTSDNGAMAGDYGSQARGEAEPDPVTGHVCYGHRSNGDWRGYKSHIWEGGHREPLIACWPGHIRSGSECDHLVGLHDFIATCAELVGADLPAGAGEDSVSFLPALLDPENALPARDSLVHHSGLGYFSFRHGDWKAIFGTPGSGGWPPPKDVFPHDNDPFSGQLFDLRNDPAEQNNLWSERPDKVGELKDKLKNIQNKRSTP